MPLFLSHCYHTTLPSHHTAITPHCHHTTLPSHHIAITPHCPHTTLPSHHPTLPSHQTPIPPNSHHTTLPSNHNAFTQYLTSRYLMGPARLLQAVTRFISGMASELFCWPSVNRSRRFRSCASPSVKNSIFLRCVTRTFEHSIIWTQEATGHFMNSEIGNKLQKKG